MVALGLTVMGGVGRKRLHQTKECTAGCIKSEFFSLLLPSQHEQKEERRGANYKEKVQCVMEPEEGGILPLPMLFVLESPSPSPFSAYFHSQL